MLFVIWSTRRDKNKICNVYVITQPVSNNEYFLIKPSKIYISYIQKKYTVADPGEGPPLFLDRTETQKAEKFLGGDRPHPPLSKGLDDRASLLLSRSGYRTDIDFFFGIWIHFPHSL